MSKEKIIIACDIFKPELKLMVDKGVVDIPIVYLDSMLHMKPKLLKEKLDIKIKDHSDKEIILLYGDCHGMMHLNKKAGIKQANGINCCEILLGTDNYRKKRKNDRAFFILRGWLKKWKEIFVEDFGFTNKEVARMFMKDMHQKMVYIHTNEKNLDTEELNNISEYFDIEIELLNCNLENFESQIVALIGK